MRRSFGLSSLTLTFFVGVLTGFFGAIPPGPLNVTVIRKASHGHLRDAYRVAIGGSLIDMLICGAIGLGFSWLLDKVFSQRWIQGTLALFLLAYGLKILFIDARRDAERAAIEAAKDEDEVPDPLPVAVPPRMRLPLLVGLLQGAANPAIFVNWTLIIGFLLGRKLIGSSAGAAGAFAVGVGSGVFLWFALMVEILKSLKDHPIGGWLRRSTTFAGGLLVIFGIYFTLRTLRVLPGG